MHICVGKLITIVSDKGLSPGRRQAIIWNNSGILLIWLFGTNFNKFSIEIQAVSLTKIRLKMSSMCWIKYKSQAMKALQWRHNGGDSVSNHQPHDCFLNRLFRRRSKKTSKLRVTGLCAGNSPEAGEFPAQMASNAEIVSIWWRHHGKSVQNECATQLHSWAQCLITQISFKGVSADVALISTLHDYQSGIN